LLGQKAAMKIPRASDLSELLRIADHRIGQKAAVREDGERVAQGGGVFGNVQRSVGPLRNQTIEKVDGLVGIRQRRQKRHRAPGSCRRQFSEVDKFRARTNEVAELDLF
jgi:hypothetical protein